MGGGCHPLHGGLFAITDKRQLSTVLWGSLFPQEQAGGVSGLLSQEEARPGHKPNAQLWSRSSPFLPCAEMSQRSKDLSPVLASLTPHYLAGHWTPLSLPMKWGQCRPSRGSENGTGARGPRAGAHHVHLCPHRAQSISHKPSLNQTE